ncbi:hypothetical protein Hdeb2414_s0015g00450841 [Helianthus debilis subsp. tardiflorus]
MSPVLRRVYSGDQFHGGGALFFPASISMWWPVTARTPEFRVSVCFGMGSRQWRWSRASVRESAGQSFGLVKLRSTDQFGSMARVNSQTKSTSQRVRVRSLFGSTAQSTVKVWSTTSVRLRFGQTARINFE